MSASRHLLLVRHAEAAAGWGDDVDPGLSERGVRQAAAMAGALAPLGPRPLFTSPLRRARETAAALASRWGVDALVDERVGEVPSPADDLAARPAWLAALLAAPWDAWPPDLDAWRREVVAALTALPPDAVVVTHFVAIRVAAGRPDYTPAHCSRTVFEAFDTGLRLVEPGEQRATVVR